MAVAVESKSRVVGNFAEAEYFVSDGLAFFVDPFWDGLQLAKAEDVNLMSAPFSLAILARALDLWGSNDLGTIQHRILGTNARSFEMRHLEIKDHEWMINVQGHTPLRESA